MLLQSNKTGVDDVVQARDDPNLKEDASIRHEQQVGHPGVNVSHTIDYKKTEILSYIKWHWSKTSGYDFEYSYLMQEMSFWDSGVHVSAVLKS